MAGNSMMHPATCQSQRNLFLLSWGTTVIWRLYAIFGYAQAGSSEPYRKVL